MKTPRSERYHIGIFGETNVGKSALLNAITNQQSALVSEQAGTTTDPIYKPMELDGVGAAVFIDTAGFLDTTVLGEKRIEQTKKVLDKCDLALLVVRVLNDEVKKWVEEFDERKLNYLFVITHKDRDDYVSTATEIRRKYQKEAVVVSSKTNEGIHELLDRISSLIVPEERLITGNLVKAGDSVVLVMPQDAQAPKGRLILPQVQTIRELLDRKCIPVCTSLESLTHTLELLKQHPKLIITDSQCFHEVYSHVPNESNLTSFSVLFAAYKGDVTYFVESARTIDGLDENSKVLIAEACTHAPKEEDIGTVKIPKLLRKKIGEGLTIDFVRGNDLPENIEDYDLVVQCGSCMFNRAHVLRRVEALKAKNVPMTNYGMVIAKLTGILDKIVISNE